PGSRGETTGAPDQQATADSRELPQDAGYSAGFDSRRLHHDSSQNKPHQKHASTFASTPVAVNSGKSLSALPRKRPPRDVQKFVAERLAEAYPHAFQGDPKRVLRPLRRAALA